MADGLYLDTDGRFYLNLQTISPAMCKARAMLTAQTLAQNTGDDAELSLALRADLQGPALLDRGARRLHAHAAHARALPGHLLPARGALAVHDEAHGARAPGRPRAARHLDASGHRAGVLCIELGLERSRGELLCIVYLQ